MTAESNNKSPDKIKSFHDLISEVQDKGICGKCGGCVAFCSAGELNALEFDEMGAPRYIDEKKCIECGICYLICPNIRTLNSDLKKKFGWRAPIGAFRYLTSARATDEKILEVATDGGVVTSLLVYALGRHLIDGVIVSKKLGPFKREPVLVTTPEDVIDAAGSHFEESGHLKRLGEKYSTYASDMIEIKDLGKKHLKKIALVGTPCQIYTVRKMQLLNILPADTIILTIGLFCTENFSFNEEARKKLEAKINIELNDIEKLNIKDDVIVTMKNSKKVHIPFELIDEVARPACFACPDFANDYADISVGGLGSPDGYTTTVLRSSIGDRVYNGALQAGIIEELKFKNIDDKITSRVKITNQIIAFNEMKKKRAKETLAKVSTRP